VLGGDDPARFDDAAATLEQVFVEGLRPR
jgi:hypothetical protein